MYGRVNRSLGLALDSRACLLQGALLRYGCGCPQLPPVQLLQLWVG
jgi:hypothetical protein